MIRKFKERDTPRLIEVWQEASLQAHPFLHASFVKQVRQDMEGLYIPNSDTWVYEEDGQIIGFISMIFNEIGALFVMPEEQSRGIGSLLVGFVALQYNTLEVEVFEKNTIGRNFYHKYGFFFLNKYWHPESEQTVLRLGCTTEQNIIISI